MTHSISARKAEHFEICVNQDVEFKKIGTGFDAIQLKHCSLPEINFSEIDTRTTFLNKELSFPFMISAMTGGFQGAENANKIFAEACEENKIALGLGSQRQLLENSHYLQSFKVVRDIARSVPVIGNIGAAQIITSADRDKVFHLVDVIEADALAVHLNPLQEVLQHEGDTNFSGVLEGIKRLVTSVSIPVIVKETGAGISGKVAQILSDAGVRLIDVGGAGGTSWAAVESYRNSDSQLAEAFWDWGIPTLQCLKEAAQIENISITASGGIFSGIDAAKALALGADMVGAARAVLSAFHQHGKTGITHLIQNWHQQLKTVMFLTGCRVIGDLRRVEYFSAGEFRKS